LVFSFLIRADLEHTLPKHQDLQILHYYDNYDNYVKYANYVP